MKKVDVNETKKFENLLQKLKHRRKNIPNRQDEDFIDESVPMANVNKKIVIYEETKVRLCHMPQKIKID